MDTVDLFHAMRSRKLSLRFLASYLLHASIQEHTHDSIEDAATALKCGAGRRGCGWTRQAAGTRRAAQLGAEPLAPLISALRPSPGLTPHACLPALSCTRHPTTRRLYDVYQQLVREGAFEAKLAVSCSVQTCACLGVALRCGCSAALGRSQVKEAWLLKAARPGPALPAPLALLQEMYDWGKRFGWEPVIWKDGQPHPAPQAPPVAAATYAAAGGPGSTGWQQQQQQRHGGAGQHHHAQRGMHGMAAPRGRR